MLLPLSSLQSFLDLKVSVAQIAETLTLLGIEVDAIRNEHPPFAGVVVGEVLSVRPHEKADKLVVATVSDGKTTFPVVCGDPHCKAGMKTAYAKVGALLADADGKQRRIEKTSIRGVESYGMFCTEAELRISDGHSNILELPEETQAGADLVSLLWDPIFELSLTPNLGHCMSALGIARELSAALQIPLRMGEHRLAKNGSLNKKIVIQDPNQCPRYIAQLIENVSVAPSPFWLQKWLRSVGMKPICNAVDITNYILLKYGQPLHAFDADLLEGSSLRIRSSEKSFSFRGLDELEREIPSGTLLIANDKKPLALAGILGGAETAVSEKTGRLLLEAAFFDPKTIRIASKKLNLRTESAIRFEKGVDPNGIEAALDEASALLLQYCKGTLAGRSEQTKGPFPPKSIPFRSERANQILGTKLSLTEMEEIFHRLGFKTDSHGVKVPAFRFDLTEEIDLVEEIARIYGYNNIEKGAALCSISSLPHDPLYLFEQTLRETLVGLGLQEFLTSDLIGPKLASLAIEPGQLQISLLKAIHAKTEEYSILRPSLLPGLLQVAKGNLDKKNATFSAFEIGRIHFLQKNEKLAELPMLALLLTGHRAPPHWNHPSQEVDFYDLKGLLENLFEKIHVPLPQFKPGKYPSFHPHRQANLLSGELLLGSFGEIHPSLLAKFDIKQKILFAEIDLEPLLKLQKKQLRMTPLPQFPSSERDCTLPLPLDALIDPILESVRSLRLPLLEKVELIDLYQPEGAPQKNATFRFTYRDLLKTVSFEEVEKEHAKVLANLQSKSHSA